MLSYFFAGKVSLDGPYRPPRCRILVCQSMEHRYCNWANYLPSDEGGDLPDLPPSGLILYKTFADLAVPLPMVPYPKYLLSGPCAMLAVDSNIPQHGLWDADMVLPVKQDMLQLLNTRNDQMIDRCDVFSLTVKQPTDPRDEETPVELGLTCYRSLCEWGRAKARGKILVLDVDMDTVPGEIGELYTLAQESLDSLQAAKNAEEVLRCHPSAARWINSHVALFKKRCHPQSTSDGSVKPSYSERSLLGEYTQQMLAIIALKLQQ